MVIRKNDENSPFWQAAKRASERVATWPLWKLGQIAERESQHMSNISLAGMSKSERAEARNEERKLPVTIDATKCDCLVSSCIYPACVKKSEPMIRQLGDYCPTPYETEDGPLTERLPQTSDVGYEVDVTDLDEPTVSLFIEPIMAGGIYLVRTPYAADQRTSPMYVNLISNNVVHFQDALGNRSQMGMNMAREHIQKRFVVADILVALGK